MVVLTAMMMYVNILQNTIFSENVCMYIHSWESLELSRSWELKEIQLVHPKGNQPWIFFGRTDAEAEALILWPPDGGAPTNWKGPWYWEGWKAGGEGDKSGWDGRMASLTRWTCVWASSRSWSWTEKPHVLHSMGLQGVRHDRQRRQWHPTPVLLPGKSHGWRSLVGCSPWGQ